ADRDHASTRSWTGASYKPPKYFRPGTNGCDADLASAFGGPRGTEVDSPGGAWAKPEATVVVFERSALVRGERGVPVLRPGLPLAYGRAGRSGGPTPRTMIRPYGRTRNLSSSAPIQIQLSLS